MTMELRELYQEIIIEHNRNPRNHYEMENSTAQARGYNPLCGDKVTVYIKIEGDKLVDLSFFGCGCAISQASASLMTEALIDKTIPEAHTLFKCFHSMLTEEGSESSPLLNKLIVLAGVKAYPARVKCATLAWHTLEAALHKKAAVVTTE